MSLEEVVFQQLQSICSHGSRESLTTTTNKDEDHKENNKNFPYQPILSPSIVHGLISYHDHQNICPITASSSSSSNRTDQSSNPTFMIPASNKDINEAENGYHCHAGATEEDSTVVCCRKRRKRRRNVDEKPRKDEAEMERQRRIHIEVERNRRKQMNHYLALLASLMPPPYSHRGAQASIVGGAINFVKELEQLLQYLQSHNKRIKLHHHHQTTKFNTPSLFSDFFSFPQYSTMSTTTSINGEKPAVADVEVTVVERHVAVRVLLRKQPNQLLRMLVELVSAHLTLLHLNVTSTDGFVLYSFSLKKEDECQLSTVNEIATAVYDMIKTIQHHAEVKLCST